jgi:tetratricopeptide (TPR) repeat protein
VSGWCHARLGEHDAALAACQSALELLEELGDLAGQAAASDSLGYVNHQLARYDRAVGCYQRAIALNQTLGDRHYEADTLRRIADSHRAAGRPEEARQARRQAYKLLRELDDPQADAVLAE